jgi:predicted permease
MRTLWQDIRYGVRMLRKNPGFTAVAVVTLALGIGANTAIFTLIEALLLRSLPVKAPQQLALVTMLDPTFGRNASFSYSLYRQWCDENRSFSGLFVVDGIRRYNTTLVGPESAEVQRVGVQAVSGNFFEVLGVPAALGRTLMPNDDREDQPQAVAVLSRGFWQRRFGLDPAVVGGVILLEDLAVTIVGVAPRGFSGIEGGVEPDLWWPIQMLPQTDPSRRPLRERGSQWLRVMGRLKPGVSREQACAELDVTYQRLIGEQAAHMSEKDRQQFLQQRIELETGGAGYSRLRWEFRRPLLLLMGIVGLVLLVACANLAGLLLARGTARGRELGVRAALGAGRLALVRQLAAESLLLALAGGVLGLLVAHWGARLLALYTVPHYGQGVLLDLGLDLRILAFTFLVSALAGVLFGLLPAWRSSRLDLTATLKNQTSLAGGEGGQFWSKVLVVAQIGVTCCLLIGAGLFVRTVQKLKALDVGLNPENLLTFELDLGKGYDRSRRGDFYGEVLRRVESLPGVRFACCSNIQSLGGSESGYGPYKVVPLGRDLSEGLEVRGTGVTRDYFATMGIPLRRGRAFGPQDEPVDPVGPTSQAPRPVILDETIARKLFGDADPVGQFLRCDESGPPLEVIGVAQDVIHKSLRGGPRPSVYSVPAPSRRNGLGFFHVRTVGNPLAVAGRIRQVVRALDPKVEVTDLQTMTALIDDQLFRERSLSSLAGFFSLLALVLACLGLYGTLSYSVVRRTSEIGVRVALGARRQDVLALVVRQGLKLVLIGLVIGLGAALAMTRLVSSLLYDVTATDPMTFVGVSLLLVGVSLIACGLPARRAAGIDPMTALRYE